MINQLRKLYNWLASGNLAIGEDEATARAVRITSLVQIIMIVIPLSLTPEVLLVEPPETHVYSGIAVTLLVTGMIVARFMLYRKLYLASAVLTVLNLNIHLLALSAAFPDDPAFFGFLISAVLPFLMITSAHSFARWFCAVFAYVLFVGHQFYYRVIGGPGIFGYPKWVVEADYLMPPLVLVLGFLILIIYQFVKVVDRAEKKLSLEYAKSEKLILNILPRVVANELKQEGVSKPKHFPSATVCFTDFEGFTQIAESLSPEDLVEELDHCFSYFDSLMDRYHLEKLKTIGDSYMFAGGIPETNHTHAVDCVMAALEIQHFMDEMKRKRNAEGKTYWELRLGIHSGDLVAGVIGEKKFAYDVWSDTVNTASRCESAGVVGKINISSATYAQVKGFFQCEYRGAVPVKNKGTIEMYFVEGLLPEWREDEIAYKSNEAFQQRYAQLNA